MEWLNSVLWDGSGSKTTPKRGEERKQSFFYPQSQSRQMSFIQLTEEIKFVHINKATEGLSEEKLQEYRDIFSFFDRDGGGTITTVELGQVMRTFGWTPTEGELQELISEIDQDGNGCISFNEFVWLMTREIHDADIEEEIREAFRVFDREGHGFITASDLTTVLQTLGDKLSTAETEELINEADIDGDGNVNYEEFVTMLFKRPHGTTSQEKAERRKRVSLMGDDLV